MHGGGPEIRGKTFRVFHKHKVSVVTEEIIEWLLKHQAIGLALGYLSYWY